MPNCFALIRKTTGERAVLQQVDDEMRQHFGAEPDPEHWFCHWYDTIGFALACGKSFEWCREKVRESGESAEDHAFSLRLIDWLDENFTADCWVQIGR